MRRCGAPALAASASVTFAGLIGIVGLERRNTRKIEAQGKACLTG
jgi:hypothetical protein